MSAGNIAHAKNKATAGNKDKTLVKKVHLILCALFAIAIIISDVFICRTGEWFHRKLHWIPASLLAGGKWLAVRRGKDACLSRAFPCINMAWE